MHLMIFRCGEAAQVLLPHPLRPAHSASFGVQDFSAAPSRQELKALDAKVHEVLPVDPTPSLEEIAARPDVSHLGAPQPAPQPIDVPLRVVVVGTDAALSAVLTRLMRSDALWVEVAYIPLDPASPAAKNFQLTGGTLGCQEALEFALTAPAQPTPLIRNDAGLAVAGHALIADWEGGPLIGEVIVDDTTLVHQAQAPANNAAVNTQLVPMLDAPGIAAVRFVAQRRWFRSSVVPDTELVLSGRAVQAGGIGLRVSVDGVSAKRPVDKTTFYRHLRDAQIVRR